MSETKSRPQEQDRLYRTEKEERTYRELKERYGLKDSADTKGHPDKDERGQSPTPKGMST